MKKFSIILCITAALFFVNASSVWEGAASVSSGGEFPETGLYAATNSFPRNTVVEITNLENDRTVRVIVSANLEIPGLLVVLSKEAADAVGLQGRTVGRVRMSQPADPLALSRFTEGAISSGDPDNDAAALVAAEAGMNPDLEAEIAAEEARLAAAEAERARLRAEAAEIPDISSEPTGITTVLTPIVPENVELTLEPAERRVPEVTYPPQTSPVEIVQPPITAVPSTPAPFITFSVPVIGSLEKGKYYIQVAALSKRESVENEINAIGRSVPIALQTTGSEDKPIYRILIGPVNLGESGALLQHYKTIYKDAFVRVGS